jgi:uncharacterized integral membrane protein
MRIIVWLVRGLLFFALFAFALNNQDPVDVHWFFDAKWRAPMVIVVLVVFACGAAVGVLAMVPSWWRHRRSAQRREAPTGADRAQSDAGPTQPRSDIALAHPPREGL